MRKATLIPMVLVGLVIAAVGFGAGFFLGSAPQIAPTRGPEPAPQPAVKPTPAPSGASTETRPAGTSPRRRPARTRSSGGSSSLRGAIESVPLPEIPTGDGVITGHVKTSDGVGVAGVTVTLVPRSPDADRMEAARSDGEEPTLEERVRDFVIRARWRDESKQTTETDAEGAYSFDGLFDTKHQLGAQHDGYSMRAANWKTARDAKNGDVVDFTATPAITVTVGMTMPDGTAAVKGKVKLVRGRGGTSTYNWTASKGTISAQPGTYQISALAGEDDELSSEPQDVELVAGQEPLALQFSLKGRPGIRGKVVFSEGESMGNAVVYMRRRGAGEEIDAAGLKSGGKTTWVHGNRDYQYTFNDLSPGTYVLGASRGHNASIAVMITVEVGEGPVTKDMELPPLEPAEYVEVRTLDPDGNIVRDVRIRTAYRSKKGSSSGGSSVISMPDGTKRVLHQTHNRTEDPDARYTVTVTSDKFGTREAEYRRAASSEVTIRYENPATLDVTLSGYAGSRYEGVVNLYVSRKEGENRWHGINTRRSTKLGADGKQKFQPLQPGEHRIQINVGQRRSVSVGKQDFTIRTGSNSLTLAMPPLYKLTVHAAGGRNTWLRGVGDTNRNLSQHATFNDGKAVFDWVPAGDYEVRMSGQKNQRITIPGTSEVRF